MQRQKLLTLCDFLCYVFTFDLFISHTNPRKATNSLYYSVLSFHFWFIYLTHQPKKSYWLSILLCVVFSLLIYLSHTPTQDMFKLLGKLMTSNINDRQDYLMINSNSIISNWVQLAVCQLDTKGGMCFVYIFHSCIIVKSCDYISPSFMYWSKLQWCNTTP